MSEVKLLAIFAENRPGLLARVTRLLANANVNIRWLAIATSDRFGVVKLLVDQTEAADQALREHGLTVSHLDVLAVEVEDKPGQLHHVVECLARHKINVENSSGFVAHRRAILLLEVKDLDRARQALAKEALRALNREEILKL